MKKFCLLFVLLTLAINGFSQKDTAFIYTYGGVKNDGCKQIKATSDSGYILLGSTASYGVGGNNIYAVKVNANCKPQWSAIYGHNSLQLGYSVTPTYDKGYAFTGFTDDLYSGYDAYLIKVDSAGNEQWEKTYGGNDWDFAYSIKQTPDSGFILCGQTYSYGAGNADVYVIKTDKYGDTLWTKAIGGPGEDIGNSVCLKNDSTYVVVGSTTSFGNADTNAYWIELNKQGTLINTRTYGTKYRSVAYSITPTLDNGFMLIGSMDSIYSGIAGEMFLKTDSAGNCQWISQLTNGKWADIGEDVIEAPDTTYLSTGSSDGGGYGTSSVHIMHHNATGFYLAGPSMGGNAAQFGSSVTIGKNGNVLFAAETSSYGSGGFDMYVIRLRNDSMTQNYTQIITSYSDTPVVASVLAPIEFKVGIKAFPNPAINNITILVQSSAHTQYYLNLYTEGGDLLQKQIPFYSMLHDQSIANINITGYTSGLYLFRIYSGDKRVGEGKFVVK